MSIGSLLALCKVLGRYPSTFQMHICVESLALYQLPQTKMIHAKDPVMLEHPRKKEWIHFMIYWPSSLFDEQIMTD